MDKGGVHLANWEVGSKSLESGDFGIGNLWLGKEALLTKWLRCFHLEPNSLWRKIIVSLYRHHPFEWVSGGRFRSSCKGPRSTIASGIPFCALFPSSSLSFVG